MQQVKESEGQTIRSQNRSGVDSAKLSALALFSGTLAAVSAVLINITDFNRYDWGATKLALIALGLIGLQSLMTLVLLMLKQRRAKVPSLKAKLISSFCEALDSSPLNPKKAKEGSHA